MLALIVEARRAGEALFGGELEGLAEGAELRADARGVRVLGAGDEERAELGGGGGGVAAAAVSVGEGEADGEGVDADGVFAGDGAEGADGLGE